MNIADIKLKSSLVEYFTVEYCNSCCSSYFNLMPFYVGCETPIQELHNFKFLKREDLIVFAKNTIINEINKNIERNKLDTEEVPDKLIGYKSDMLNGEVKITERNINGNITTQNKWFYFYDYDNMSFKEEDNNLNFLLPVYARLVKVTTTFEKEVKQEGLPYKPAKTEVKHELVDQYPLVLVQKWTNRAQYDFYTSKDKNIQTYNRTFSFYINKVSEKLLYIEKKED
jgi:hypothetical protein